MSNVRANWQLALVCASRRVDLISDPNTGGWSLAYGGASFTPPSATVHYGGTLPRGGQTRVGNTMSNARFTLKCHLLKQSGLGELQRNIHEVQRFMSDAWLSNEAGTQEKVYLVRRLDEGYSGIGSDVVLYGRGDLYYEILSVDVIDLTEEAYTGPLSTNTVAAIANIEIILTCLPYGTGKVFTAAEATGWVRPDNDGNIEIWQAGSNLMLNSDFEYSASFSGSWNSNSPSLVGTLYTEKAHTGFQSVLLSNRDTSSSTLWSQTKTLAASTYAIKAYVNRGGGVVSASDCFLFGQSASVATTFTEESGSTRWYKLTGSFTGVAVSASHGIAVQPGKTIVVDSFQLEPQQAYDSPQLLESYQNGPGVTWDGSAHASQLTRAKGIFRVPSRWGSHAGYETLNVQQGAFSAWVKTPWAGNDGLGHYLFDTIASTGSSFRNRMRCFKHTNDILGLHLYGDSGSIRNLSINVDSTNWPANQWLHIFFSWCASGPESMYIFYPGGSSVNTTISTGSYTEAASFGAYWYLGSDAAATPGNHFNGTIGDVRIFGPDAVVDASALHNAGRGKSELGFVWTNSLNVSINSASDASNTNWFYVANIPGDMNQPLRIFVDTDGGSWSESWLSLHKSTVFPYRLNTVKLSSSPMAYGGATCTADTTRVDGYYVSSTTPSFIFERVLTDGRQADYVQGRYRVFGILEDQNSYGTVPVRINLAHNAASGGIITFSNHIMYRIGEFGYAESGRQNDFCVVDFGVFNVPVIGRKSSFFNQDKLGTRVADNTYLSVMVAPCGGTAAMRYDYLVFMQEDGLLSLPSTGSVAVIDGISRQAYQTKKSSACVLSLEPTAILTFYGEWPIVPPNKWIFCNFLTDRSSGNQTPADRARITIQYQPAYYWAR